MTDKNVTRKPLTLKRETLRTLTETELRLVAGGGCRRTTYCN